ncbi:MAG: hypothetical protein BWY82_01047 [Verrucomicrobia bacterium ADurb.Bin474]|nr:MAG: hypothetical protein BWY82_01047 [Verrucomicrobia bacterium ADurb.Bin474]
MRSQAARSCRIGLTGLGRRYAYGTFRVERVRSGFSLIEVLLALMISMIVIASVTSLFYVFANAWLGYRDSGYERDHAHGVVAFLDGEFSRLSGTSATGDNESVQWMKLPEAGPYDPEYLSWKVTDAPPFLSVSPAFEGMALRVYLRFERERGLSLIWHPEDDLLVDPWRDEPFDPTDHLYEAPLTPMVDSFLYAFYDSEKDEWDELDEPWKDQFLKGQMPDVLVIRFLSEDESARPFHVYLPSASGGDAG